VNIERAKTILLDELLLLLGYHPAKQQGGRLWYRSPFRHERTASFVLAKDRTAWYDHGQGVGGNIIDLAKHLGDCSDVPQALDYLDQVMGNRDDRIRPIRQLVRVAPALPAYSLINDTPFAIRDRRGSYTTAAAYLKKVRGIEPEVVAPYLSDLVYARPDGTHRYGFGVPTIGGGYEARRAGDFAKLAIGPKNITVFQSSRPHWQQAPWHCFYSLMDFGTFLGLDRPAPGVYNYLIVNSDSLVGQPPRLGLAEQYLATLPAGQSMIHYPHNDSSGQRAFQRLQDWLIQHGWSSGNRSQLYAGYKDWNEWHQAANGIGAAPPVAISPPSGSPLRRTPKM